MNSGMFTKPNKMGWVVVQCTVDFVSIKFSGCFICIAPFIFMLITAKESWSNHVVYTHVVMLILTIEPWYTSTSSLQVYVKLFNKKVINFCWFYHGAILINSHTFSWMLFILKFCQDKAYDSDWFLLEYGGEYPENFCISAYNSENWGEAADISYIVKWKVHVKEVSCLEVICVHSCTLREDCHFSVYQIVHFVSFFSFGKLLGSPVRVWWRHIVFMALSEVWRRRRWTSSHEIGVF